MNMFGFFFCQYVQECDLEHLLLVRMLCLIGVACAASLF